MVLATADRRGRPSARWVLLKEATERGFVFYTNADSRKGREMHANDRVALAFYWDATGRQVRVEGRVRVLGAKEADAYWAERPLGSRYASAAQCEYEVRSAESLFQRYGVPVLNTTECSIEEIASRIIDRMGIERRLRP